MTDAAIKVLIAQVVATALAEHEANRGSGNGYDSHDSGSGRRTERATHECTYSNFLKCQPLNFKGTEGVWNSHVKTVGHDAAYEMSWKALKKMITDNYTQRFQELALMCGRMFPEKSDEVEKYVGGLPDMIQESVMASKLKTMQDAIEFLNDLMDQNIRTFAERQAEKWENSTTTQATTTHNNRLSRVMCRCVVHGYNVSSLMDTAYWSSE
ncbi:hypothetical protein Tco_0455216 [Tanacetum coccineum]